MRPGNVADYDERVASWLLKADPDDYGFTELQRDQRTAWTGVKNAQALSHMRSIRRGDEVFIYHTGDEKRIVGIASAAGDPYPDPDADDEKRAVIDIKVVRALKRPVSLAQVKADKAFKQFLLVRNSRLSVMPVAPDIRAAILELAGE
jgi:predicted RNA-binding protein with PUA-like domain